MKTDKFNLLYESIMKKLGVFLEDTEFHATRFDNTRFEFKKDENNNVICTFSVFKNSEKYIVISKYFNEKLSFNVIDELGTTKQMTEKEFAVEFYKDYDDFKEAFDQFKSGKGDETLDGSTSTINQFGDVLKATMDKEGAKDEKLYTIDGMSFAFRLLKDQMISTYCECQFQIQNEDTSEVIFYKALILVKQINSVIIKIMSFDEKGNVLEPVMPNELQRNYPDVYKKLFKAIKKMSRYLDSQKMEL